MNSQEKKEYHNKYYQDNKLIINERAKTFYYDNITYKKNYNKEYREHNKEYFKQYKLNNKDKYDKYKEKYNKINNEKKLFKKEIKLLNHIIYDVNYEYIHKPTKKELKQQRDLFNNEIKLLSKIQL